MAKARKVVGDINSAELDHLKRQFNTLLLMIETAATSLTAGASAADVLNVWSAAISTGVDNNPNSVANVTSTGREIEGIWSTPKHPDRRKMQTVSMDKNSKF